MNLSSPRITPAAERGLVLRAQAGDRGAADILARAHFPFMRQYAGRFATNRRSTDKAEALSAVFVGFCLALVKFDVDAGVRFLTYARHWFRHALQAHADRDNLFGHAPSGSEERVIAAMMRGTVGVEELAAEAGAKLSTVESAETLFRARRVWLDHAVLYGSGEEGVLFHEVIPSDAPTAEGMLLDAEEETALRRAVAKALGRLADRERSIVEQTIMADEPVSLAEVGRQRGFSRARAQQIQAGAKVKLREWIQRPPPRRPPPTPVGHHEARAARRLGRLREAIQRRLNDRHRTR